MIDKVDGPCTVCENKRCETCDYNYLYNKFSNDLNTKVKKELEDIAKAAEKIRRVFLNK